jgi:hypothetical protein
MRAFLFCVVAGVAPAQDYKWQVESSMTYETGKYGSDQDTTLFYWPVTLKRYLSRGDVAVTAPYLNLDTPGGVTVIDGAVVAGNGTGGSGLGDVSIKGRYNWIEQNEMLPYIDLVARLKLPTADEGKGLGTGEPDMGFGVELSRRFLTDYIGFADLSYTFIGDPPGVDYDNRIDADIGLGYQFTQEWMGSVSYDYRSAISASGTDARSVSFLANYKVSPQVRTYGMVEIGLSDGAPDYGLTVGASYRF